MGKKTTGRKRHLVVDTLGLLLVVMVTSASVQDRRGGRAILELLAARFPSVALVWAGGGYANKIDSGILAWAKEKLGLLLEIVKRSDDVKGFQVLPRRWVVERTFGWLIRNRRLARDYERPTATSEAMVKVAMIRLMATRLAGQSPSCGCRRRAGCGAGSCLSEGAGGYLVFDADADDADADADDADAAVEFAARIPAARHGGAIGVRPVTTCW